MMHKEFNFNIYSTNFYGSYFQPESVKAAIVLIHGMGEHSKRYEKDVIPYFNQNSIAVITYDQFGHGKTEGKRGHNPGFEAVLDCVTVVLEKTKELYGDVPIFLYGHSMGGNVVINYALRRKNKLKGVIATSPFLQLAFEPPSWKLFLGKILLKVAPQVTMQSGLEVTAISRDKNEIEAYKNDPLIHDKISPNYSVVFMETGEWAMKNAKKLKIPMLLLHGTGDRLTSYKGSEFFAQNATKKVTLKLFHGAYHELHNDIVKQEVMDNMITWINKILT